MNPTPPLTPLQKRFVLHWGEMGPRWGVSRTVAEIYAFLFISPEPRSAEEIADALFVARSNVSTSLKELQAWGLVRSTRALGDRRDRFETGKDVWEAFQTVLEERRRREIDPTVAFVRECLGEAGRSGPEGYFRKRLEDILDFFETSGAWYDEVRSLPRGTLRQLMRMGRKVQSLVALGRGR